MKIDWFTVVAEIVNFLILVALLKYFLYDRIIGLADEREREIASRFEEAEEEKRKAEEEADNYRQQRQEIENQQEQILEEAQKKAESKRKEMFEQARQEVEEARNHWYESIQRERDLFVQELREHTSRQVYVIAKRALSDLADAELNRRVLDTFVNRLRQVSDEQRDLIAESLRKGSQQAVVSSAFEITNDKRNALIEAIRDEFGDTVEVAFSTSDDLILGIELRTNGHKIAWNIEHYLEDLEQKVYQTLDAELKKKRAEEINGSSPK